MIRKKNYFNNKPDEVLRVTINNNHIKRRGFFSKFKTCENENENILF